MAHADLAAKILIDGSAATVCAAFQQIEGWPTWYPGVVGAQWMVGVPWREGAIMQVRVKNSLGMVVTGEATVLPMQQGKLVWENRAPGLVTLCHAWAEPSASQCRFTLQKFYRGGAAFLLRLLKGRQEQMLQTGLRNLQQQIEAGAYPTMPTPSAK